MKDESFFWVTVLRLVQGLVIGGILLQEDLLEIIQI